jgi:hypothetical protein
MFRVANEFLSGTISEPVTWAVYHIKMHTVKQSFFRRLGGRRSQSSPRSIQGYSVGLFWERTMPAAIKSDFFEVAQGQGIPPRLSRGFSSNLAYRSIVVSDQQAEDRLRCLSFDIAVSRGQAGSHTPPGHCRSEPGSAAALPDSTQQWNLAPGCSVSGQDRVRGLLDPTVVA